MACMGVASTAKGHGYTDPFLIHGPVGLPGDLLILLFKTARVVLQC